ncbi:XRE family transcriptional regulator [Lactococcus allomyrinae]|uniref:XRE family transcriptional regulator n=1 Tax=Lactococcus allomyrinae TaxID=2419773 RepID=A0A387BID5_9LACT|nr:XRE family transcriptional regulator [Lactococcus allomyrinae]
MTSEIAKAIRRKAADLQLSQKEVCKEIGITPKTYSRLKVGGYHVRDTVYIKVTQWLVKDY